jgi:phosphoenolpyruvate carboxylase
MADVQSDSANLLAEDLQALTARLGARANEDPFGNPILLVALAITRRMDTGELTEDAVAALRDEAFADRAKRTTDYVGGTKTAANDAVLAGPAQHLLRPDPNDSPVRWAEYRALVERTRFAAVFTAHPTFALPLDVGHALAEAACGRRLPAFTSHRPPPIDLEAEFLQAVAAIANGRDAIDRFNAALIAVARSAWPDRWTELTPRPVILSSWVAYDTDIDWWDMLRLRLEMKRLQLIRLHAHLTILPSAGISRPVSPRLGMWCPLRSPHVPIRPIHRMLPLLPMRWSTSVMPLTSPQPLLMLFRAAITGADDHAKLALCVVRAGLVSHGLGLAHTHVRLNAAQLHNMVR